MSSILRNKFFVYLAGLAFFFMAVRYYGYFEDAGRYLLQAVHMLHPERFMDDVPFMFGNQDEYTIFSPLIALFFYVFGVNQGGVIAVLLMELFWGCAALTLVIRWTRHFNHIEWSLPVFVACIVTLTNKMYGCSAYFPIIDHILVARFCSEIFILFGLAFFWAQSRFISLGFFFLATLLHPLMGGWGIPLWLFYHYSKCRLPFFIFITLVPLTGFLHIGRFDFFPKDWFGIGIIPFIPNGKDTLVFVLFLLFWFFVWKFSRTIQVSNFASSMFWIILAGVFWQYAGIGLRHQLLVQAQPYRVLWMSFIPMFPIVLLCVHDWGSTNFVLKKYIQKGPQVIKMIFIVGGLFLAFSDVMANMVQLFFENNVGTAQLAFDFMDFPSKLSPLRKSFLVFFSFVCLLEQKRKLTSVFVFSVFNDWLTLLPLFGILFYLFPNLKRTTKRFLIAFVASFSLVEFLSSLENSPMLDSPMESGLFFMAVFSFSLCVFLIKRTTRGFLIISPLLAIIVVFTIYGVRHWDVRNASQILDEKQMDAFFAETIFPQIEDRGRILFVENGEYPLQSRFKFLTGTYADESINVGELFFKGQYIEARHRKNVLLLGDTILGSWGDYSERIANVYANPDTLLARVNQLCGFHEISHFATDYANMPLPKADSVFLDVKQKYVWLYECAF